MNIKPQSRKENIVIQELEKELLIYDLAINKAFSLNETCAMVWAECDGEQGIPEIASILSRRTKGLVNEEVVWLALDTLQKENLLTDNDSRLATFNGMNRRQLIRKVGYASMVVITLITSLIAPTAANAASGACVHAPNGFYGQEPPGFQFVASFTGFNCAFCPTICSNYSRDFFCCSGLSTSVRCFSNGGFGTNCDCVCS